jgi:adenylylsulfate kinase
MTLSPCKILIMGLPGSGKTTLASVLAPRLKAVHFNADEIRARVNKDLGFTPADRIEQAARMGFLCNLAVRAGHYAVADFVCPTPETRAAFGAHFVIWVDRIEKGRFEDTDRLFVPPRRFDLRVTPGNTPAEWTERIALTLRSPRQDVLGSYA